MEQYQLAALRLLRDGVSKIEKQRQKRIERGDDPTEVDRDTAQLALTGVIEFFLDTRIETKPLIRLLSELVALSAGARSPGMLVPAPTRNRRPDAPTIEAVKGRLAAIMEFRQQSGDSRKAAGTWVVQHLSSKMKLQLGLAKRATVDSWLVKWGGQRGATSGSGREGYLHMRAILRERKPTEPQVKRIIETLAKSLPS